MSLALPLLAGLAQALAPGARADGPPSAPDAAVVCAGESAWIQPAGAVAPDGTLFVVGATRDGSWRVASRAPGGADFVELPAVDTGRIGAGRRRGPRVAAGEGWVAVTAVASPKGSAHPQDLLAWRLDRSSGVWSDAVVVNDAPRAAGEGMHDMARTSDGALVVAWNDGRENGMQVRAARSNDGGATWSEDALVYASPDGSICPCCPPAVAADGDGVAVAWRNALGGARDMWIARGDGLRFDAGEKLGQGTWTIDACPMAGGALARTGDGLVTAWLRDGELFRCRPGAAEESLGRGAYPAMATARGGAWLAWIAERETGELLVLGPGDERPRAVASDAAYPAWAGGGAGDEPLFLLWEQRSKGHGRSVRCASWPP